MSDHAYKPGQVVKIREGTDWYKAGMRTAEVFHPSITLSEFLDLMKEVYPGEDFSQLTRGDYICVGVRVHPCKELPDGMEFAAPPSYLEPLEAINTFSTN